jgi:hypothetical protein
MPSESSTSTSTTSTTHSVSSKPKSASSKSPAATAANVAVPSTTTITTSKKIGLFAKVRALPVYIQVLGIMVLIAFVYVATNKKALNLFEKKSGTTTEEDAEMSEGAADEAEADGDDASTDDESDEAEPSEQLVEQKTVRFEEDSA